MLKSHLFLADQGSVRPGSLVFTVGFPDPANLGQAPKFTEGTISAMSGFRGDDTRLQISVPIQPGNSGGPLVDETGSVVGIIVASVSERQFQRETGALPQNVNYAVKAERASLLFPRPPVDLDLLPWLIGGWEGHTAASSGSRRLTFDFTRDRAVVRWSMAGQMSLRTPWIPMGATLRASGTVVALSPTQLELRGSYDAFSMGHPGTRTLLFSLRWNDGQLSGQADGLERERVAISLRPTHSTRESSANARHAVIRRVLEATCLVEASADD